MFADLIGAVLSMANKVCMICEKVYGTHNGAYDSHGVCSDNKCQAKAKAL